jgi:hypothetical protein
MSRGRRRRDAQERSNQFYKEFEANIARINAEKLALRRIEITGGDEVALGCKSSGWPQFKEALVAKLLFLRKAKIGRADQAAAALNRMGFKTGSGQPWTPRLINIAKMKLLGVMSDRLLNAAKEPEPKRPRRKPQGPPRRPHLC